MADLFRKSSSEDDPRLPSGQRLVKDWPVLTYGATPDIRPEDWSFKIWGEVEREIVWTWDEFLALGQVKRTNDIHCVTTWSRYDNEWEGVLLRDILAQIAVKHSAASIMFHCYGGYTTNVTLADIAKDDHAMIAIQHDGHPIPREHGGPARGVIPSLYFWKSAKWVEGMELMPQDRPGFWEMYGYHIHGDPWKEERYS